MAWMFPDAPNAAVITSKAIVSGRDRVAYVSHDAEDGGWQFHGTAATAECEAAVVGLREIIDLDPSLSCLADLPLGWFAARTLPDGAWRREPVPSIH